MGVPVPEMTPETSPVDEASAEPLLSSLRTIAARERRNHASVYNYWLTIRGNREFPPIHDLDPLEISDAGAFSILLEMIGGGEDAEIRHLGRAIAGGVKVLRVSEAPNPSLLSCIATRLPVVAACRDAFAFEDEFETKDGKTRCWVSLLPFSATGTWIDFVYGFVSLDPGSGAGQSANAAEVDAEVLEELKTSDEDAVADELHPDIDNIPGTGTAGEPDDEPEAFTYEDLTSQALPIPIEQLTDPFPADELREPVLVEDLAAPEPLEASGEDENFAEAVIDEVDESDEPLEAPVIDDEPDGPVSPEDLADRQGQDDPGEAQPLATAKPGFSKMFLETLASVKGFYGNPVEVELDPTTVAFECTDAAEPVFSDLPSSNLEGTLQIKLTDVRAKADEARQAKLRANAALYEGLSAAYDFALDAEDSPDEYLKLVQAEGLKIQLRSPMKPVAKLAFDGMCDDAMIKQLEAVLSWAFEEELPRGTLAERIEAEGGIGPILNREAKAA